MNNLVVKEYLGNSIEFKVVDGCVYANANRMAETFGGSKKLENWKESPNTQRYIEALKVNPKFQGTQLIVSKKGNSSNFEQGTWIHEKLILNFARYLNVEFELWCDEQIATLLREGEVKVKPATENQLKNLEIRERYSKVKMAEALKSLIPYAHSETYKEILIAESAKVLTGREILQPQKVEERSLTATEVGEILGISKKKVGILANKYNLKTEKNGCWVHEKAQYCNKEVPNFRYFKSAIAEFKKVLNGGN